MMRTLIAVAVMCVFSSFTFGQATSPTPKDRGHAEDEEAIRRVLAQYDEYWNTHEWGKREVLFAEDADRTNIDGVRGYGRADRPTPFRQMFGNSHNEIKETRVRFIKSDVAAVDCLWEMTGAKHSDGRDWPLREGLMNLIMTKETGTWLIKVFHNMDLPLGDHRALIRRYIEAANAQRWELLDDLFAPEFVRHNGVGPQTHGVAAMKKESAHIRDAWPDFHWTIEDMIAEGDKIVVRMTGTGTHRAEFFGLPPTGKTISFEATMIYRIAAGRIAEQWRFADDLGRVRLLGGRIVPANPK